MCIALLCRNSNNEMVSKQVQCDNKKTKKLCIKWCSKDKVQSNALKEVRHEALRILDSKEKEDLICIAISCGMRLLFL